MQPPSDEQQKSKYTTLIYTKKKNPTTKPQIQKQFNYIYNNSKHLYYYTQQQQ